MKRSTPLAALLGYTVLQLLLSFSVASSSNTPEYDFSSHPRFVCTPMPVNADPSCFPNAGPSSGSNGPHLGAGPQNVPPAGWWGASEEAKATILHLRESLVQQKETILEQRETIRELTAKLVLCEGLGHTTNNDHHNALSSHHAPGTGHHTYADNGHHSNQQTHHGNYVPDSPQHPSRGVKDKHVTPGDSSSPEHSERMLQALKERLENLQKRNSSMSYSSSLKELLQRKISALEQQVHHNTAALSDRHHGDHSDRQDDHQDDHHDEHYDDHQDDHRDDHRDDHHDDDHDDDDDANNHYDDHRDNHHDDGQEHSDHHDDDDHDDHYDSEADNGFVSRTAYRGSGPRAGFHVNKLETMLNQLHLTGPGRMSPDDFLISFPMRTSYMYGRMKKTLLQEIFAFTLCLWIKPGMAPGLGTPFSYSAPGQSNEIVLIEWGNNPIELLVDDEAVTLPLALTDERWHHVCVTWSTRDGHWEAYQDGVQMGSGVGLSPWHAIKPGGVFILGQEQDTLGGRFDAAQSFMGEMSEVHLWSHVLSSSDIHGLSTCGSHLHGDVLAWTEAEVELHGGVTRHPYDPCH